MKVISCVNCGAVIDSEYAKAIGVDRDSVEIECPSCKASITVSK